MRKKNMNFHVFSFFMEGHCLHDDTISSPVLEGKGEMRGGRGGKEKKLTVRRQKCNGSKGEMEEVREEQRKTKRKGPT
uniref:Uncharacterized protein n=1 Tax=Arundo donax TaxID=35708 RepID=A0A0A9H3L1_ARUDO